MNALEELIGGSIKTVTGDPSGMTAALICLFFFILLIVVLGMNLSVGLVILIPLLVALTAFQGFPQWMLFIVALGCGGIIYLAVKQWLNR